MDLACCSADTTLMFSHVPYKRRSDGGGGAPSLKTNKNISAMVCVAVDGTVECIATLLLLQNSACTFGVTHGFEALS